MKLPSLKAAISGSILMGLAINGAYGQCVSQSVPLKDNSGDYVHYFLNRANAPGSQGYSMGELFFAVRQSGSRVQLGKYNSSCWTKIIGWVQKKYLIEGLRPLTVGQAAKQFPALTQEPGVKPGSTLWLRALQKPEYYKEKPLTAPNPNKAAKKDIGLEGLAYRWRHVYALDSTGNQLWYLVGSQSRLFQNPRKDTSISQKVLLGWVSAKANQVLATNIGVELNTTKVAVDERIRQNKPVVLYKAAQTNSQPLSKEALEVWDDYKRGKKTAGTLAWIEPEGIDPSYPRFYIHSFNPNTGWYHVSTWGSVGDTLKPSDITRLAGQLQATLDRLRTVDIVVVFDRSGSMSNELAALKRWLIDFSKDLAQINAGKTTKLNFLGQDEQFTIGLKINFSLVLFEAKQDYPIFKRVKLPKGQSQVINGINSISLIGGWETVFDTLTRVVPTNSGYWENGGFSQRFILVMMDEPGDIGAYQEANVKGALPLPSQELTEMGYNPNSTPATEWTKIWGVYTESNVAAFRNNVNDFIVGKRLRHIPNFENSSNKTQRFKKEMMQVLKELQQEIEGRAKRFGNLLVQKHQAKQQGKQRQTNVNIPATMKLQDAAIQAALKDAGTSLEELSAIVGVAFVDGHLPLKDQGRQYPSVQEVVVQEENELRTLRDNVHSIGAQIEKSFQPSALSGGILGSIMQKVGSSNRQEKVAASLLYAILATAGDTNTLNYLAQMDKVDLLNLIRGWLRENAENNIAFLLGMQTSIETSSKGLLNRPLKEIVEMDPNTIRSEARLLLNKSHCMGKILDGRTIPIEVEKCPNKQGVQKGWKYEQGNENYIYVPMRVIP
jgi:hypothetical protein